MLEYSIPIFIITKKKCAEVADIEDKPLSIGGRLRRRSSPRNRPQARLPLTQADAPYHPLQP